MPAFSAYWPSEYQTLHALGVQVEFWQTLTLAVPPAWVTLWTSGLPLLEVVQLVVKTS